MKLPTVDKFFFCLSLKTGAMVLAGLSIFASISVVTISSVLLTRYVNFYYTLNQTDQDFFRPVLITLIIVYSIVILYFGLVSVAAVMLVVGTLKHDHNQILLFLIMMAVGVIVSFIQVVQLGVVFIIPSVLSTVCSIYFFICVYSLYKNFKNEKIKHLPTVYYDNVELN